MQYAEQMLEATPHQPQFEPEVLVRCIDACFSCAQACTFCADACLGEEAVTDLARCIRLNLDCADVCEITGRVLSRQFAIDVELAHALVEGCAKPADAARTSASGMRRRWVWSTAASARRPAVRASRRATTFSAPLCELA